MKQEKLLQSGWAFASIALALDIFLRRTILGDFSLMIWLFMLYVSAYSKWNTARWVAMFYIVFAGIIIAFTTCARITPIIIYG